jgi:hypothetical protein
MIADDVMVIDIDLGEAKNSNRNKFAELIELISTFQANELIFKSNGLHDNLYIEDNLIARFTPAIKDEYNPKACRLKDITSDENKYYSGYMFNGKEFIDEPIVLDKFWRKQLGKLLSCKNYLHTGYIITHADTECFEDSIEITYHLLRTKDWQKLESGCFLRSRPDLRSTNPMNPIRKFVGELFKTSCMDGFISWDNSLDRKNHFEIKMTNGNYNCCVHPDESESYIQAQADNMRSKFVSGARELGIDCTVELKSRSVSSAGGSSPHWHSFYVYFNVDKVAELYN